MIDDPVLTARSVKQRWAGVTLYSTDGRAFAAEPRTPRGDADQPMIDAEISKKFHLFADSTLGANRADRIEALAGRFDQLDSDDFNELLDLCAIPPAGTSI